MYTRAFDLLFAVAWPPSAAGSLWRLLRVLGGRHVVRFHVLLPVWFWSAAADLAAGLARSAWLPAVVSGVSALIALILWRHHRRRRVSILRSLGTIPPPGHVYRADDLRCIARAAFSC